MSYDAKEIFKLRLTNDDYIHHIAVDYNEKKNYGNHSWLEIAGIMIWTTKGNFNIGKIADTSSSSSKDYK